MFGNSSPVIVNQQQGGAKPPGQGGLFGNTQPTSGALFGQSAQTDFGTSTQPTTSPFCETAPSNPTFSNPSPFGQPIVQGQQSQLLAPQQQSQFGMQNPPHFTSFFGQAQPFGSTQQNTGPFGGRREKKKQQSQAFGCFGSSGINPPPFGSTQTNSLTPSFGSTLNPPKPSFPSPFGNNQGTDGGMLNSATDSINQGQSTSLSRGISQNPLGGQPIFGSTFGSQQQHQSSILNTAQVFPNNPMGDNKPVGQPSNGFGQPQFNNQQQTQQTGFGNPSTMTFNNQKDTFPKPFSVLTNANNNRVNTITFMPEYQKKALALLRLEDYIAYKTNPNSIQNNVAKANIDQYFQKIGEREKSMLSQFNNQQQTQQVVFGIPSTMSFKNPKSTIPKRFTSLKNIRNYKVKTITFMPFYQNKTLQLLRLEDYTAYKTDPNTIEDNSGKFNLDKYFKKLRKLDEKTRQKFNEVLILPVASQINGGFIGSIHPSDICNPLHFPQFCIPITQNRSVNLIGGGLLPNALPSMHLLSQSATWGFFPNSNSQSTPIISFPSIQIQNPSSFNQTSFFPNNFGVQNHCQLTNNSFLQFPVSKPATENKTWSFFDQSKSTPATTSSLPSGPHFLNTGVDMELGITSSPRNTNQSTEEHFFSSKNQIDVLLNTLKSLQAIMNINDQRLFPRHIVENIGVVSNLLRECYRNGQKDNHIFDCNSLNAQTNISKIPGSLHESLSTENQTLDNLDDELRSIRLESQRQDSKSAISQNRSYGTIEQDIFMNQIHNIEKKLLTTENTMNDGMNNSRDIQQNNFIGEDQNTNFKKVVNQPNFNLNLEIERPNRKVTFTSGKFKPHSMIAKVLKFLVEDKCLLNESDLTNITVFAKGEQVFILTKLEEIGLVDDDVLTIKLEKAVGKNQEAASNSWMPIFTKEGYKCKPSLKEMSQMTEEEISALPHFEISNMSGKIEFDGPIDVRGLNLDKIVYLNDRSVEIYRVCDFENNMPSAGTELNRPCVITFFRLIKVPIKDIGAFVTKIERIAKAINAEVRLIDSNTGEVSIFVESFK
jgi:hypothetical protein